jgi:hypothetical protein
VDVTGESAGPARLADGFAKAGRHRGAPRVGRCPEPAGSGSGARGEDAMGDVIYVGLGVAFFALSWAFVRLCERL